MDASWALEVMDKAPFITVCMSDANGMPYSVPLSLARTDERTFYFHCATEGKKLDILRTNPFVCLSAVSKCKPTVGPKDGSFTLEFKSAIATRTGNCDLYTLKMLRKWNDLIYDPLTGRMGLKAEYVAPQVVVTLHDKANQPFWQWTLYHVWPTVNLPVPNLNYMTKNELYKVTGYTLACDYWDEVML